MATDLTTVAALATWPVFVDRVRAAMVHAAVDVGNEGAATNERAVARHRLASDVFDNSDHWTRQFAWAAATNPSVDFNATDDDIQWTVNAMWNALSGAGPDDTGTETTTTT